MNRALLAIVSSATLLSGLVADASSSVSITLPNVDTNDAIAPGTYTVCHVGNAAKEHQPFQGGPISLGLHLQVGHKITVTRTGSFGRVVITESGGGLVADVSTIASAEALIGTETFMHLTGTSFKALKHLIVVTFIEKESFPEAFAASDGEPPDGCSNDPSTGLLGISLCWEGKVTGQPAWLCAPPGPHLGHVHAQD